MRNIAHDDQFYNVLMQCINVILQLKIKVINKLSTVEEKKRFFSMNGIQRLFLNCVYLQRLLFQVFEAVIAWVNHDKDVRQEHLAQLMEHVRLPLLSREYLVQVCVFYLILAAVFCFQLRVYCCTPSVENPKQKPH